MKLDRDCVRDILLAIEEHQGLNERAFVSKFAQTHVGDKYGPDQSLYTTIKLFESGYINGRPIKADGGIHEFVIYDLTPDGHAFIENIRDPEVWNAIKSYVEAGVKSASLAVMAEFAKQYVKQKLNLL